MSSWLSSPKHSPTSTHRQPSPQPPKSPGWGSRAINMSDKVGGVLNTYADKLGIETFWPTTGDMPREMEKAARILKHFTIPEPDPDDKHAKSQYVRIPPSVIAQAKGIAIYSCVRGGCAPMGAGGGSGVVLARLPNGTWSAPAAILPTAVAAGMQIGLDVYNAVLIIRSESALKQFGTHRFSLGGEISVAAGPYGGGHGIEGKRAADDKTAVYCYMHSRGAYIGVEVVGTVFVSRTEENAAMYNWPGIQARDILTGKVQVPAEASSLMQTLRAAETGVAMSPNFAAYGPGFGSSAPVSGYMSGYSDPGRSNTIYYDAKEDMHPHMPAYSDGQIHVPKHDRPGAYFDDGKQRGAYSYPDNAASRAGPSRVPPPLPRLRTGGERFVAPVHGSASPSGPGLSASSPVPALIVTPPRTPVPGARTEDRPPPPYSPSA